LLRLPIEIGRAIRHELLSTLGTLLTVFLAMSLPGALWIISNNLSGVEHELKSSLTIDVFLVDELSAGEVETMRSELLALEGVTEARYLSSQDALYKMRETFGLEMIQDIDENPLPASFVLRIDESIFESYKSIGPGASDSLIARIAGLPGVEDVVFSGEMLHSLSRIVDSIEMLGIAIGILVAFSAVFIVANTVRVAISDRKRAVEIMQLVGATRSYILTPFVSLGGLLGLCGGSLAALFLWLSTNFVSQHLVEIFFFDAYEITAFILTGLLLGMIGALLATNKFLKI
jgi:cell division transport system permease protein